MDASASQGYHPHAPSIKFAGAHLYPRVERGTVRVKVLHKNTTQCPQPGLEHVLLNPKTSTLTMRPPRLPVGGGGWVGIKQKNTFQRSSMDMICS